MVIIKHKTNNHSSNEKESINMCDEFYMENYYEVGFTANFKLQDYVVFIISDDADQYDSIKLVK